MGFRSGLADDALPPLFERAAEVGERRAIRVQAFALGSQYGDELRREVEHLLQLDLRPFAVLDIEVDADPIEDRAISCAQRLGAAEEPAVRAGGTARSKTDFARRPCLQAVRPDATRLVEVVGREG